MSESLLQFGDGRNDVAFFMGKIQLRTPIERVAFSKTARGFETHKVYHSNKQNTLPPFPPSRFFTKHILGGQVTSRSRNLSPKDKGRQWRESLGTRLRELRTKNGHLFLKRTDDMEEYTQYNLKPQKLKMFTDCLGNLITLALIWA